MTLEVDMKTSGTSTPAEMKVGRVDRRTMAGQLSGRIDRLTRLRDRLRDVEWRRYAYLLLAGKALGIAVLFGAMYLISSALGHGAHAD